MAAARVLARSQGPRVLQARIVAPDELPVALLAVAEGSGVGLRRAWRETVAEAPWLIDGLDVVWSGYDAAITSRGGGPLVN